MFKKFILAGSFAALLLASPAVADPALQVREDRIVDTVLTDGLDAAKGQWRTRVQVIFDPKTQQLERRAYELFDLNADQNLTFTWQADDLAADRPGKITGAGRLVWREANKPAYDDTGITSVYRGTLRNGRAEGQGLYATRDGLSYDGQWKAGRPHGRGRLVLPNGEEYEGEFRDGFAEGAGRNTETTWERFEGTFRRGLRSGAGKTTLPSGLAYESNWAAGRETPNSYRIRVAQVGAAPAVGGTDDVRMGVTMNRKPNLVGRMTIKDVLLYAAKNVNNELVVQPDDPVLMGMWKGSSEIFDERRRSTFRPNSFSMIDQYVTPVIFSLNIQNRTKINVEINKFKISVIDSKTDKMPMVSLYSHFSPSCGSSYEPTFSLTNYGWGDAYEGKIEFDFQHPDETSTPKSTPHSINIGNLKSNRDEQEYSFEDSLENSGLNIKSLDKIIPCKNKNKMECLNELKKSGVFGKLSEKISLSDSTIYTQARGYYRYKWIDAENVTHIRTQKIVIEISIGSFPSQAECGAGGPHVELRQNPITLENDKKNYTIDIPHRSMIGAGRSDTFTLPLTTTKATQHKFRIIAILADGREISSPMINMTYYRPKPQGSSDQN